MTKWQITCNMSVQMVSAASLPTVLVFCASYELGSFSKAGRQLGITPQAASRAVVRLERSLGTALFRRTTRLITPTDAGRAYFPIARQALDLLASAERVLQHEGQLRGGQVRISAPTTFGHHRLLPFLASFRERYPHIALDVHIGNRNIDFAADGFDLAVRMGAVRERGLVARKLGDFALGVYAAPSYLARRGTPKTPAQLAAHECLAFVMPRTGRVLPWTFVPGPTALVPPTGVRCSEDVLATVTLARAGAGLLQTYDFLVTDEVRRGALVEVLREFRGASRPFSLLYPQTPKPTAAARTLIDALLHAR
jgi:DNA-binding transcriptional LysR family regulator